MFIFEWSDACSSWSVILFWRYEIDLTVKLEFNDTQNECFEGCPELHLYLCDTKAICGKHVQMENALN